MDEELQPRVDSAYLAKNFLTNLQGPKEDFLMDSREISPQQIASLSRKIVDRRSLRCFGQAAYVGRTVVAHLVLILRACRGH